MSTQIETLKKRLSLGSLPESAKAAIRKQIEQLEGAEKGLEESATKQQEKLEKEEEGKEAEVDDKVEKLKKRLTLGSLPESAKAAIRKQIEDAEKLKTEAKKERAEEKKEAEEKKTEAKAKVEKAVKEVEKAVKEAPKKAEKAPEKEKKAVEKKVEKEVKEVVQKAKTEVKKAKVEAKKADAKKAEGAKKRKKKFDKMLSDLQRFINKDKKLKALYGSDSKEDLKRDAGRMAKPFGWRYKGEHNYKVPPKSERGNEDTYYEGRPEKADLRRRTYPYLEMGGDVMAKGGDVGKVQMYYHKTSGGAEYLCSEKVAGTKEGSMKAKYVVRIDGAKNGSEMIIKPAFKNVPMYYHKTSGGAEYLCSEKVAGTKEGSMKAKYVVRIDGAKSGNEMIIKGWEYVGTFGLEEYADGGMMDGVKNWMTKAKYFSVETETQMTDGSFKKVNHQFRNYDEANDFYEAALVGNKYHAVKLKGRDYSDVDIDTSKEDFDGEYLVLKQTNNMGESDGGMVENVSGAKRKLESMGIEVEKSRSEEFSWFIPDVEYYDDYNQDFYQEHGVHMSDSDLIDFANEFSHGGMMAKGGKIKEGDKVIYKGEKRMVYAIYPNNMVSLCLQDEDGEDYEDVEADYLISMDKIKKYALGGMFKSRYNTGRSWHLDHARHNKKEDYEIPMPNRKGAKKVSSSKSSAASKSAPKRAKTGKYAKASRSSASASSSSRGYNYIPNSQIKSITTVDDKVITKKKILDGAYVRKKNGGMM